MTEGDTAHLPSADSALRRIRFARLHLAPLHMQRPLVNQLA